MTAPQTRWGGVWTVELGFHLDYFASHTSRHTHNRRNISGYLAAPFSRPQHSIESLHDTASVIHSDAPFSQISHCSRAPSGRVQVMGHDLPRSDRKLVGNSCYTFGGMGH